MTTERFHLGAVLSMTTGKLLCNMEDIYRIAQHLAGEPVFTHQLGRVMDESKPHLLAQFPALASVIGEEVNGENFAEWLLERVAEHGEFLDVAPMPEHAHESNGTLAQYTQMLLRGMTLGEIGEHFGVTQGAVRKALKAAGMPTQARALLAAIPEGCTPTDAEVLRAANFALAKENHELKAKLRKVATALADLAA